MYWEWMSSCEWPSSVDGSSAGEVDTRVGREEKANFKDILLAVYDTLCKRLPGCDGLAYGKVCFHAFSAGFDQEKSDAFAALYFAINHNLSPFDSDLDSEREYVPLADLLHDATEWIGKHPGKSATYSLGEYAQTIFKNKPSLTQLAPTNKIILPTSRLFWDQPEIASYGTDGRDVPVGGGATVYASISGGDGKRIAMSAEQLGVQIAIGQLVQENGVPLTLSPAQIYRAWAGLPQNATVHATQEEEVVAIMDSLIFAQGEIDMSVQLEKHKGLAKKTNAHLEHFGKRRKATLIVAAKDTDVKVCYNGREIKTTYKIYDAPLFYLYSYAIGQMAAIDRSALGRGISAKALPAGNNDRKNVQNRTANINVRYYLIRQVERMKSDKKASGSSARAKKQTSTDTHTENLIFSTIAKACTIEPTSKRMRMLRENTRLILEEFVTNGYILSFGVYKEGRAITGVWISV